MVPRNHFVQEALIKVRSYVDCRVESVARKPKTLAMDSNHSSEEELEEIIKARSGRSCTNVATHHQTSAKSIEDLIEQKSRYEPIIILSAFFLHIFPLSTFNLIFTYLSFGTNSGFFLVHFFVNEFLEKSRKSEFTDFRPEFFQISI